MCRSLTISKPDIFINRHFRLVEEFKQKYTQSLFPAVAVELVAALGPVGDANTLEPSAGTGNLLEALLRAGPYLSILDRYHVMALMSKAIDNVRAGEARQPVIRLIL